MRRGGKRVVFRTLDIGSDKVLPYMKKTEEPNPALGWRAIRVGLDKPGVMRMQLAGADPGGRRAAADGDGFRSWRSSRNSRRRATT